MKQYRLKKDLPDYKAGEIISKEDDMYYRFDNPLPNGLYSRYSIAYVESNPDWFEKVEPKHKLLELLEDELLRRMRNPAYNKFETNGFDWAVSYVRNYLQSEPLFCEGVKEASGIAKQVSRDEMNKHVDELISEAFMAACKEESKYSSLMLQARAIQPNAGDSYYVELGKLLDKHLREERG